MMKDTARWQHRKINFLLSFVDIFDRVHRRFTSMTSSIPALHLESNTVESSTTRSLVLVQ